MKKYIILLPVILYPYAYLIYIFVILFAGLGFSFLGINSTDFLLNDYVIGFYHILCLFVSIYSAITVVTKTNNCKQAGVLNLVLKCIQIPGYLINFVIGFIGLCMGIWGIGIVLFILLIDLISITLTGLVSMGCMIKLKKEGALTTSQTIIYTIFSFIFCFDILFAILAYSKARKHYKAQMLYV